MPRRSRALVLASTLALGLSACGSGSTDGGADAEGSADLQVVASFYPVQYLVERVAGEHAEVSSLTAPGVDPHSLELSPRDVGSLGDADLVVYSAGMQAAVDDAVESQVDDTALDVAPAADLLSVSETEEEHAGHSEEGDEDREHEGDEGHEGHDHGSEDPHFWLDPERYGHVVEAIADRLVEVDPDHAADYEANAASVVEDLDALDADFEQGLADCTSRDLVTTHEAFGYLAERYDLHQMGITGISPEAEPSAARLAEISSQVEELGVTTIYAEPILTNAIARTVAQETGTRVLTLDPLGGITEESAGEDYLEVMRANLEALSDGLGCS
ncbi:Zinc ABC transporter, periplasmic-binding protein ZnuA [Serinicoccus hydrothermalis]|uniref:Zinc ABC transporter, periplasmic-binding protein ZnuA n=1 Tax=Serinicoccus hydrothermalis TaxID=1758689 RepID=A0A1B1N7U0_9MICO|nr:metal ABC transporter substrate-binding protein [Serinicoccus hydrothermalis]ANS77478.1 Zinc ABC transporter, periplasmic-binding protein ZnuA [Serinicoccus hydrothermalis]